MTDGEQHVCDRCGHVASSPINLWAHRHRFDLLSSCDRYRLRQIYRSLALWKEAIR